MVSTRFCAGLLLAVCLAGAGCDRKAPQAVATPPASGDVVAQAPAAAPSPAPTPAPLTPETATIPPPDVGKLETVKVTADGFGASASEAVAEALRLAILQVNGATVDVDTVNARLGIDATFNQTPVSLRASAFAEAVFQKSGGVVQNFRMLELSEPLTPLGKYKASIEAGIAKFRPPESLKKIKLVVAPLRFDKPSMPMGDRQVPAAEAAAQLRQLIVDALVNTGRFAVLDREFSPELQQELDLIESGQAPAAETAKLRQAASADVLWIGKVHTLAYNRHARQLRTSDRELVSYSGGWSMSHKLVNVATRQVMASESLRGEAPATAPTTLGTGVNSAKVFEGMTRELVDQVVASIIGRTFPITVVALEGNNVVLSQGGQALRAGARYAMVTMGTEMKDPQTGQSLGRLESPCCQLVIDRVTPNLSYGHLENVRGPLDKLLPGALQVREGLPAAGKAQAQAEAPAAATPQAATKPAAKARPAAEATAPPAEAGKKQDDKW